MEKLIDNTLEKFRDTNLHSAAGRQTIVRELMKKIRTKKSKLAEEIIDNKDVPYVYESPDGGKTVFRRGTGESKRELVSEEDWKQLKR